MTPGEGERWRSPLIGLSGLVASAYASVIVLHKRNLAVYPRALDEDARFRVMPRLQANACRVAKEIVALLSAGYPKGAIGRWRTLHEISLITCLIAASERTVAERYEDHSVIQEHKKMARLIEMKRSLGAPLPPEFVEHYERVKEERLRLVSKHGRGFRNDYGWAQPPVKGKGNRGPGIDDIERAVGLGHMRLIYAEASQQIHSNPNSVLWHLDPGAGDSIDLLFGPNTDGLSTPGVLTAYSMKDVMTAWTLLNRTGNPYLSPSHDEDQLRRIKEEADEFARAFIDCETDVAHLLMTASIVGLMAATPPDGATGS